MVLNAPCRGLDPFSTLVRISSDGGAGSFKVIVNLFNPDDTDSKRGEMMSGVIVVNVYSGNQGIHDNYIDIVTLPWEQIPRQPNFNLQA